MSNSLTPFDFNGKPVRTVLVDGDPWFVAADACSILEISNTSQAVSYLDEDESQQVAAALISNEGRPQDVLTVVSESGLYSLVLRSRKPEAKKFKKWITREVLPQIRKTGSYSSKSMSSLDVLAGAVQALQAQEARVMAVEAGQKALEKRLDTLDENSGWFAAKGWAKINGFRQTDNATMSRLGRRASKILREMGIAPKTTTSEQFGTVGIYPEGVLDRAADEIGLE